MQGRNFLYSAFVSYRHVDLDRKWAKWLISRVESYRTPKPMVQRGYPKRLKKLFRDDDEIPASSDLGSELTTALDQSEYLIVICSPDTPDSKWIRREIEYFQEMGRGDRIIPLLVHGEPEESFPVELRRIEKRWLLDDGSREIQYEEKEPVAADVRKRKDENYGDTKDRALLRITSVLLKCKYDELKNRDRERERHRKQIIYSAAAVLISLLSGLTIYSWQQGQIAKQQTVIAVENERRATENEKRAISERNNALKSQGEFLMEAARNENEKGHYDTAILFGLNALPGIYGGNDRPEPETLDPLATAVSEIQTRLILPSQTPISDVIFSPDGKMLAIVPEFTNLSVIWNVQTGKRMHKLFHAGTVQSAAFSSDNKIFVTGSDQGINVYNLSTGKRSHKYKYKGNVFSVTFSPDNKLLAFGSSDNLIIRDLETGRILAKEKLSNAVSDIVISRDGRWLLADTLALMEEGEVILMDLFTYKVAYRKKLHRSYADVTFSKDNHYFIMASDNIAYLCDRKDGSVRYEFKHEDTVTHAIFSPNGLWVLTTSRDKTAVLWSIENGKKLATYKSNGRLHYAGFSPDSHQIITESHDGHYILWDTLSSRIIKSYILDRAGSVVRFSPKGRLIAANSPSINGEPATILWDATSNRYKLLLDNVRNVMQSTYSPDNKVILTRNIGKNVYLWDQKTGKLLHTLTHEGSMDAGVYSADGKYILTASYDKNAYIWHAESGKIIKKLPHKDSVSTLDISSDSKYVVTASRGKTAILWELETGKKIRSFMHDKVVRTVKFVQNGQKIVTSGNNKKVTIWDAWSGVKLWVIETASYSSQIFFNEKSKMLVINTNHEVLALDMESQKILKRFKYPKLIRSFAISPDNTKMASIAYQDNKAIVWDMLTGNKITSLAHKGGVNHVTFSNDSKRLLTASEDNTAILWSLEKEKPLQIFNHDEHVFHASFSHDDEWVVTSARGGQAIQWKVFRDTRDLYREAIKNLPIGRKCLTNKERNKYFLDTVDNKAKELRGCKAQD